VNVLWITVWKSRCLARTEASRACLPSQAAGPLTMAAGGTAWEPTGKPSHAIWEEQIRLGVVRSSSVPGTLPAHRWALLGASAGGIRRLRESGVGGFGWLSLTDP
jgi:hypothetical protein